MKQIVDYHQNDYFPVTIEIIYCIPEMLVIHIISAQVTHLYETQNKFLLEFFNY